MTKFIVGFFVFIYGSFCFSAEVIESYSIDINVDSTGKLAITETIKVRAEGFQIKRGIYRSFPTRYEDKNGFNVVVDFDVISVHRNGKPEPYHVEENYSESIIYAGEESVFLSPGVHTYEMRYTTSRQLGFFNDFDELYFNAIGGQWDFAIEQATVHVIFPVGAELRNASVFSGLLGNSSCNCEVTVNKNELTILTTKQLDPKEYLTFAVAFQKGVVIPPTFMEKVGYFLRDNLSVILGLILLSGIILFYYILWRKVGVDPRKGTIVPLFEPPNGYSPAEVSFILNMKYVDNILTASLVNMAIKGHIKIKNKSKVFSIQKLSDDTNNLTPEERLISKVLFPMVDLFVFTNKNAKRLQHLQSALTSMLSKKKMPKYFLYNSKENSWGVFLSISAFVIFAFLAQHPLFIVVFALLMTAVIVLFKYLLKAPTIAGRLVMDEIEGFKMYMDTAEQRFLDSQHEPDLNIERFEKLLPYAIALGVENRWAKKFEKYLVQSKSGATEYAPSWYSHSGSVFRPSLLTAAVASSFSSAIATSSTPPGSSSGTGGGGFSGGGGGGGGGGGW